MDRWRHPFPVNMEDPMAIRRQKTRPRVSFLTVGESEENIKPSKISDETAAHSSDSDLEQIWTRMTNHRSILMSSKKEHNAEMECHINKTFDFDKANENHGFVSSFGKKGKNIGEYQDVKSITCLSRDQLLVTDYVSSRLQICSYLSSNTTLFAQDKVCMPWDTVVTKSNCIAVTMCKEACVKTFSMDGDVIGTFGEENLENPTGIATDKNENFIVCDSSTNKVSMFDSQGEFIRSLGNPDAQEECFSKPYYVCVSVTDDIIVSDGGHHEIKLFSAKGDFLRSFGSLGRGDKQFKSPYGVATDRYGNIFVADHYNSRISMFTRDGVFVRHVVTSEHGLVHPQALTVTPDLHMFVSHGHLKASEILVFQLTTDFGREYLECISHV